MKKFIIFLIFLSFCYQAKAQIIKIYEQRKDLLHEIKLNKSPIVDINSHLEVAINRDSLITKTSLAIGINKDLMARINKLNYILENQIELLKSLEHKIKEATRKDSLESLGAFSTLYAPFLTKVMEAGNEDIRVQVSGYYPAYNKLRGAGSIDISEYPSPQAYAVKKLAEDAKNVLGMMSESEDFQTLTFQLVAFLNTKSEYMRKVHIINFDNYAEGEYLEIERFVTSFSEKDKATFKKTQDLADQMNELIKTDLSDLNGLLKSQIKSIDCIRDLITQLQELYENPKAVFQNDEMAEGESFLKKLSGEFVDIQGLLSTIASFNPKTDESKALDKFEEQQKSFIDTATNFPKRMGDLISGFKEKFGTENDSLNKIIEHVEQCIQYLNHDIKTITDVSKFASHILDPFRNTAEIADEVAGNAFSFSLDNLPSRGYINLKTTGKRQNGDDLEIRLKVKRKDSNGNEMDEQVIEMRTLTLQQIKIYSITKITLILAYPPTWANVQLQKENDVQFAPSGSLLFKFGSRESKAWNFISMGAGFNISTPDFDLNGSPDVAFGGIITILKDIVSFGYSYNTTTNTPFWFVGLSIPVTLPGIPINNVQSEKVGGSN